MMRPGNLWTFFGERLADRFTDKLMLRMEQENALPLPARLYDITVDDPEMVSRHEYLGVEAISPVAAAVEAYRRALRDETFRVVSERTDERGVSVLGIEASMWAVVHLAGQHPHIDYSPSARRACAQARRSA